MDFPEQELIEIVEAVWGSMLALDATHSQTGHPPGRRGDYVCCVQIMGEWQGAVTMQCSRELTVKLTAIMFGLEPHEVTPELMRDALGELAHMIAGNVKALTPGSDHHVSMPAVAEGEIDSLSVRGSHELGELVFDCLGSPFSVSMLERSAPRG
ncbi:MAG: chemotaxis protein CheX [Planctomycetes bacterium]|nr:chemotaxis protein CheX [Planctomycetota bacterium]